MKEQHQGRKQATSKEYKTRKWTQYSVAFRKLHPLCVDCGALSQVVDHIIPVNAGGSFYDVNNHAAMCHSCHNKKSATTDKALIAQQQQALTPTK